MDLSAIICQKKIISSTDWKVYGMDMSSDRLTDLLEIDNFNFFEGDITINKEWMEYHIKKCDVILPLVAIATPSTYVNDPLKVFELDFEANLPIVRKCVQYRKRLIFPSTSEVYGMSNDSEFNPYSTEIVLGPIHKSRWIYSCSKQLMDRVIHAYGEKEGLDYTLFRPFNWYGTGLDSIYTPKEGSSRVITMNSDIKKVYENNDKRGLLHKELFIPSANSILFQKNDDQIEAQGQVPEYVFLDKQPIFIENTDNALLLDFQETFDKQFLKQNSIRYITIRNDVAHHHWKQPHNYLKAVQKVLDSSFKKVYDSEIASTYLVKDFIPAFYICREDDYTFNTLAEINDYGICTIDLSSVDDLDLVANLTQQEQPSFVEYTKISPVEYRVNIKGIKRNSYFLLRFFQKYDSLWDLVPLKPEQKMEINSVDSQSFVKVNKHDGMDIENYKSFDLTRPDGGNFVSKSFYNSVQNDNITGNKEKLYLLNRSKIDKKFHIPIDANSIGSSSYIALNGWIINTDYLMNNYKDYITPNNDGLYDIEFKVLYYPQKIFYLGLVISASFLLVILLIFLISRNNITIPNNQ